MDGPDCAKTLLEGGIHLGELAVREGHTDQPSKKQFFRHRYWSNRSNLNTYKTIFQKMTRTLPFDPRKIAKHPRRAHAKYPVNFQKTGKSCPIYKPLENYFSELTV